MNPVLLFYNIVLFIVDAVTLGIKVRVRVRVRVSKYQWYLWTQGLRSKGLIVSRFHCPEVSRETRYFQGFKVSWFQGLNLRSKGWTFSRSQGLKGQGSQGLKEVKGAQGTKVSRSKCPNLKPQVLMVSMSQGLKVSRSQGLKFSRSQGLKVSRSQGLKVRSQYITYK